LRLSENPSATSRIFPTSATPPRPCLTCKPPSRQHCFPDESLPHHAGPRHRLRRRSHAPKIHRLLPQAPQRVDGLCPRLADVWGKPSGILSCQAQPRTHAPAGTTALGRPALACWCGESLRLSDGQSSPPAVPLASIVLPSQHPPVPLRPAPRRSRKTSRRLLHRRQLFPPYCPAPRRDYIDSSNSSNPSAPSVPRLTAFTGACATTTFSESSPSTRPAPASRDAMPTSPPSSSWKMDAASSPRLPQFPSAPFSQWSRKFARGV